MSRLVDKWVDRKDSLSIIRACSLFKESSEKCYISLAVHMYLAASVMWHNWYVLSIR
jgi:hypothetical protein